MRNSAISERDLDYLRRSRQTAQTELLYVNIAGYTRRRSCQTFRYFRKLAPAAPRSREGAVRVLSEKRPFPRGNDIFTTPTWRAKPLRDAHTLALGQVSGTTPGFWGGP